MTLTLTEDEVQTVRLLARYLLEAQRQGSRTLSAPVMALFSRAETALLGRPRIASDSGSSECASAEESKRDSNLIGVTEAAELLGCSERRVRQIAADLDGTKVGRAWLFSRVGVAEYVRARGR